MGHYNIGPRIGAGGMAEVHLGTQEALGGFRKLVVMKRLLGWQSDDNEALERLLDEARIAATINHPNVVTTLDIGMDRGSPYIVLEYLSGEDLLFMLRDLSARDASIPLDITCRIGASIAAALSNAHDLAMPDGTRRCIVHRDVTPSNIIVCYRGVTKLVDFGVARVVDDVPKTKAGIVKGKFSYLAPEQLTGAPLDGRTDVFQLGIVLWEMVTMRRLFDGKSDPERINAILNRAIKRPSELNPTLPPCLDRTIMRALERDPARRHQAAHELEAELLDALGTLGASGGDHSVGKWMQTAFAERYRWRQDLERRTIEQAIAQPDGDGDPDDDLEIRIESKVSEMPLARQRLSTAASGSYVAGTGSSLDGLAVGGTVARPSRGVGRFVIPALLAVIVAVWWWRGQGGTSNEREPDVASAATAKPADYEVDIRVVPAQASIAIDGVVVATGRYRASFADDGAVHTVTFTAADHATVQRRIRSATTLEVNLEPLVAGAPAVVHDVPAVADATEPPAARSTSARPAESARPTHDARQRPRERSRASTTPTTRTPDAGAAGSAATSADPSREPAPSRTQKADDSFAPASDNIDPF